MKEIRVKFLEKINRTASVESFRFGFEGKIDFLPGQFLEVVFDEANRANKELNKYLSLSSSPTKDYLEITKRISTSKFSQKLLELKPGSQLLFKIPLGECFLRPEYTKIGFLIGGIGITPVVSIFEYIMEKNLDTEASLFYSNRTDEDIAFKKELDLWQAKNKNLKVYYTVTDCQPKDKACSYGYINKELLLQKACDLNNRVLFIFGPPAMVDAMRALAQEMHCPNQNIKTEKFVGY